MSWRSRRKPQGLLPIIAVATGDGRPWPAIVRDLRESMDEWVLINEKALQMLDHSPTTLAEFAMVIEAGEDPWQDFGGES